MASLSSLSSEVILRILAHLDDASDVVHFRETNRRMNALGSDGLLWKRLFVQAFLLDPDAKLDVLPVSSLARKKRRLEVGDESSDVSRTIEALPKFVDCGEDQIDDGRVDWYMLYKISQNWNTGSYSSQQLRTALGRRGSTSREATRPVQQIVSAPSPFPETIVDGSQDIIFTSSRSRALSKRSSHVQVFPANCKQSAQATSLLDDPHREPIAEFIPRVECRQLGKDDDQVAALAADRSSSNQDVIRVLIAYRSGILRMVQYNKKSNDFVEELCTKRPRASGACLAVFHWPYVAICTEDFRINIFRLGQEIDNKKLTMTLVEDRRSYSCHWPACLKLAPLQKAREAPFRLSIAYTNPVYPLDWTVSLQEFVLDGLGVVNTYSASARPPYKLSQIDSTTNDKGKQTKRSLTQEQGISRLSSLSYEEPFIVVGSRDNSVFCFRVDRSLPSTSKLPHLFSIQHVQTMHGHTGSVHSVSLSEGRCVTGGSDGSVRVWRLGDEEASLARAVGLSHSLEGRLRRGLGKVITLRLPGNESSPIYSRKRKRDSPQSSAITRPLTLSEIMRSGLGSHVSPKPSSIVRWVASAFDRIISISTSSSDGKQVFSPSCRFELGEHAVHREEELVQIWNFSS